MKNIYDIRKNWITVIDLVVSKPVVLMPFLFIAFIETLALEFIYFSARNPMAHVAGPIIRKLFGENFLHYPENFAILPRIFYYKQVAIYIFLGVFLTAISVNMFKNIKENLPLKFNALLKNAFARYAAYFGFGLFSITLITLIDRFETAAFYKFLNITGRFLPKIIIKMAPMLAALLQFASTVIVQVLLILTIPLIVMKKKRLFAAIAGSIIKGMQNFRTVFLLIFLPYLLYLPVLLVRAILPRLMDKIFPEISVVVVAAGIAAAVFIDSFITFCVTQFLMDTDK